MTNRPRIPQATADNLMFANDHTCCICRVKGKHVQIHHIDGDNSNNSVNNLAVLCLECHSKATGDEGLGRSITAGEIKEYKRT
jgi:5-methylcytosine-specific restriction endonuclease McrA